MQIPETGSYCHYVSKLKKNHPDRIYHDNFYGKEVHDDNELFGRLILEINQAGLSWTTILQKQDNLRKAYSNFNIKKVSMYSNDDIESLLNNTGVIRNRLKINAIIYNANKIIEIQKDFGSFYLWLKKLKGKDIEVLCSNGVSTLGGDDFDELLVRGDKNYNPKDYQLVHTFFSELLLLIIIKI